MKRFAVLVMSSMLAICSGSSADEVDFSRLQGLGTTHYLKLDSSIVERTYHLFVRLPESYEESEGEKFPTIYLLDGGITFPLLSAYYRYLSLSGEAFDAILVGISYGTEDWRQGNGRSTDFTAPAEGREFWGGAEFFQKVFEKEVFPWVEGKYRSNAERRVIFGQSLGGQFALYSALTRPELFWGHIASNPALHRNLEFFLKAPVEGAVPDVEPRVFVSSASGDEERFREPAQRWIQHWSAVKTAPWRLKTLDLQGHNHFSAAPEAFRRGLLWLRGTDPTLAEE